MTRKDDDVIHDVSEFDMSCTPFPTLLAPLVPPRVPHINHPVDKILPKTTSGRMNNSVGHKCRDYKQVPVVEKKTIQKDIKNRQVVDLMERRQKIRERNGLPNGGLGCDVDKATNSVYRRPVPYQVSENIHFGLLSARDIVYQFLLDDHAGSTKGHRQNILNRDFRHIGKWS